MLVADVPPFAIWSSVVRRPTSVVRRPSSVVRRPSQGMSHSSADAGKRGMISRHALCIFMVLCAARVHAVCSTLVLRRSALLSSSALCLVPTHFDKTACTRGRHSVHFMEPVLEQLSSYRYIKRKKLV